MMILLKLNCIYNDQGAWCTNKNVKRSLFGIGARCCVEFDSLTKCEYKKSRMRPPPPPPPPPKRLVSP